MEVRTARNRVLVSVIVPCFNHGKYLPDAVDSLLNQTYKEIEVIIVDDGSTDSTHTVAEQYAAVDARVRYIRKSENAGLSAARNTGIMASHGDLIHFLDADDFISNNAIEEQVSTAEVNPQAGLIYSRWRETDATGAPFGPFRHVAPFTDTFHELLVTNIGPPCCVTVRRGAFDAAGLFDVNLSSNEDWDMWLRMAASGIRFAHNPFTSAFYRKLPDSMSSDAAKMWATGLAMLRKLPCYHPQCPECRKAIVRSKYMQRKRYLYNLYLKHIFSQWKSKQYTKAALRLARALAEQPSFAWVLAVEAVLRLSKKVRSGKLGREQCIAEIPDSQ